MLVSEIGREREIVKEERSTERNMRTGDKNIHTSENNCKHAKTFDFYIFL